MAFGGQKTAKDRVFGSTLGPRNKVFHVFWPPGAKNDPPSENTKKHDFEKIFLVFHPKMTPTQKTQKKTILKRIFWYLMPRGHIWPLVARKRSTLGPRNKVFHVF